MNGPHSEVCDAVRDICGKAGRAVIEPVSVELISGGKSNLTYRVRYGPERWVLRRPPLGDRPRGAHDMAREFRVMNALADTTVPVPRTIGFIDLAPTLGCPAYLMEEVAGDVLRTRGQLEAIPETGRAELGEALVATLVALHEVDPAAVGLQDLGDPEGFLRRQLARWTRELDRVDTPDRRAFTEIVGLLERDLPRTSEAAIVHGDYRLDNVMVDHRGFTRIAAVLDWEMATHGDPLADLGTLVTFCEEPGHAPNPVTGGLTNFPGFPTGPETAEMYLSARDASGRELAWYVMFCQFKLAVILEQIAQRHRRGHTRGEGFDGISELPPALLSRTLDIWHEGRYRM